MVGFPMSQIEVHPPARETSVLQVYRCTCIRGSGARLWPVHALARLWATNNGGYKTQGRVFSLNQDLRRRKIAPDGSFRILEPRRRARQTSILSATVDAISPWPVVRMPEPFAIPKDTHPQEAAGPIGCQPSPPPGIPTPGAFRSDPGGMASSPGFY